MARSNEGKSCVLFWEQGAALKIVGFWNWRGLGTDPVWLRPCSKLPERCLLLSKAPCCQRPEGSSHRAGS